MPGLDINWFRAEKGHDPNIIRKSLERRFRDPKLVDRIIEEDQVWRKSNKNPIKFDTIWILWKRNGTTLASRFAIRRKPTRKTLAKNSLNSRLRTNSSRNRSKRKKKNTWNTSISSSTQLEISSMTQFQSATMKIKIKSSAPGGRSLISKSLTKEEGSIITKSFRLLEDTTPIEVRKSPGIEDTSSRELGYCSTMPSSTMESTFCIN